MKEKQIKWLTRVRGWKEDIPEQMLDGSLRGRNKEYKCRKSWFYGVRNMADQIISTQCMGEAPEILKRFIDYVGSEEFVSKERTTSEDITFGNQVIEYMLNNF